jgi:hypothetical protein
VKEIAGAALQNNGLQSKRTAGDTRVWLDESRDWCADKTLYALVLLLALAAEVYGSARTVRQPPLIVHSIRIRTFVT